EQRHRAGQPEAATGVELVGLGPDEIASRLGGAEERPQAGPVAMIVRALDRLTAAIGPHAVLFHADALAVREAPVHVEGAGAVPPRPHEAVLPVAIAHPGELGMGAEHAEREALEGVEVRRVEPALG